jgi:hypothetical protein
VWEAEVTKHTRSATAFHFNEFLKIIKPTGQQAQSLRELLGIIRAAEPDVIYHHMCRGYLKYTPQLWDYPNDFARWATHGLGTQVLAERLANINPFEHGNIEELRQNIIYVIEDFMWENQYTPPVRPGFEFHFERSTGIILPTRRYAKTLPGSRETWTIFQTGSSQTLICRNSSLRSGDSIFISTRWKTCGGGSSSWSKIF